jgi:DNA replication licensing factor MCM6
VTSYNKFEPNLVKGLAQFMKSIAGEEAVKNKTVYAIAIHELPQTTKIRDLRTSNLGRLMSVYGTVTRTTDAKPELIEGTFKCQSCMEMVKGVEQ